MNANEIRNLGVSEIEAKIVELKNDLFTLRFQQATGQLTNNSEIRTVRKTIARMKTIIHERATVEEA